VFEKCMYSIWQPWPKVFLLCLSQWPCSQNVHSFLTRFLYIKEVCSKLQIGSWKSWPASIVDENNFNVLPTRRIFLVTGVEDQDSFKKLLFEIYCIRVNRNRRRRWRFKKSIDKNEFADCKFCRYGMAR
jgi:hypothetical protein